MYETELESFFDGAFEHFLNEKLFIRDFVLDKAKMAEYTDSLITIPIRSYLDYMVAHIIPCFAMPQDIVQFSSLEDATTNFCLKVAASGDEGLRYVDVGRLLLDDGKERKAGALIKYGENHAKTAVELSLAQNICDYIYLSCLGVVFNDYSAYKQHELLKRLVLRNRFIQRLAILSQKMSISLVDEMSMLSESTIKRRLPNIRTLFGLFDGDELFMFSKIIGLNLLNIELKIPFAAEGENDALK